MDYRVFHAIDRFSAHHHGFAHFFNAIENVSIPVLAIASVALWLLARPGGDRKWKAAAVSALGSAAVALLVNTVISWFYDRPRPYESHAGVYHLTNKTDPSFPSGHASAAFAIATAVLLFDRIAGALFLVAAILVGFGRIAIGAHYPADVLAGIVVGVASGVLVVRIARPLVGAIVRIVERLTDPILRPLWRGR
ncbi:MAG: phosphatase PAP2 family protein [Gaiellaceae bacterium]